MRAQSARVTAAHLLHSPRSSTLPDPSRKQWVGLNSRHYQRSIARFMLVHLHARAFAVTVELLHAQASILVAHALKFYFLSIIAVLTYCWGRLGTQPCFSKGCASHFSAPQRLCRAGLAESG